jgi:hypothetical protein
VRIAKWLLFAVLFVSASLGRAQTASPNQESGSFPAMLLKTHSILTQSAIRPAWELQSGGELTVRNGSIEFHNPTDPKASFAFPISNVRSLERRRGPEGFPVLRIKLQNGKNFDLVPDLTRQARAAGESSTDQNKAMSQNADSMEKAIRDMAVENKVVLK